MSQIIEGKYYDKEACPIKVLSPKAANTKDPVFVNGAKHQATYLTPTYTETTKEHDILFTDISNPTIKSITTTHPKDLKPVKKGQIASTIDIKTRSADEILSVQTPKQATCKEVFDCQPDEISDYKSAHASEELKANYSKPNLKQVQNKDDIEIEDVKDIKSRAIDIDNTDIESLKAGHKTISFSGNKSKINWDKFIYKLKKDKD